MVEDDSEDINELLGEYILIEVPVVFTLRGREVPFSAPWALRFEQNHIPEDVEQLTDRATEIMMGLMDSRSMPTLVLEGKNNDKSFIERDEVQAWRILAPNEYDPKQYSTDN